MPRWKFSSLGRRLPVQSPRDNHHFVSRTSQQNSSRSAKSSASVRTTVQEKEQLIGHSRFPGVRQSWDSFWRDRTSIVSFAILCIALLAGLLILWYTAGNQDGLNLVTNNHYTWSYGPTALLIFVVAVWRQIDFRCKQLAPWAALQTGNTDASNTVLLDYVSPFQAVSLFRALKSGHSVVFVSIIGFILLKLITLASTGLLLSVPTSLQSTNQPLIKNTAFNGSLVTVNQSPTLNDTSLVYTAYGILIKKLSFPEGIHDGLVYPGFELTSQIPRENATVTAEVHAVVPEYFCESAPVEIILQPPNTTDPHPNDAIQMLFPECQMPINGTGGTPAYALNPQIYRTPSRQLSPVMQRIDCLNDGQNWQLLTLTDFRYNQTTNDTHDENDPLGRIQASAWSTEVRQTTSIACRSSYRMESINITYDLSQTPLIVSVSRTAANLSTKLDGLSDFDLGSLFTASMQASADMFGNVIDDAFKEEYPNTMFKFMAQINGGGYEALLDENAMIASAEKVFQSVAAQIVHKYFVQKGSTPLSGVISYSEDRLQINELSLWFMTAGFAIMCMLGLYLVLFRPQHVVPRDTEPSASMALILAQNQSTQNVFQRCSGHDFFHRLKQYEFSTRCIATDDTTRFMFLHSGPNDAKLPSGGDEPNPYYKPLFIRRIMFCICLVLPLATVATLEALQRVSDANNGIASVPEAGSLSTRAFTRYIPALVMLLIATMVNAVDFNIALFAPYQLLLTRAPTAAQSTLVSILGKTPPHAIWTTLKQRNWGALISAIAALLASLLTIVASGLYTVDPAAVTETISIRTLDTFNTTWMNSVIDDGGAALLTSLSETTNFSYPQFTYNEVALSSIRLSDLTQSLGDVNSTLSVHMPALRAGLNCTKASASMFNVTSFYSIEAGGGSATVTASFPLPPECLLGGPGGNLSTVDLTNTFKLTMASNSSYVGKVLDVHVGPFDNTFMSSSGELNPNHQNDNPPGCPSLAFIYGYIDISSTSNTTVNTLLCHQQLDSTLALTTFSLPSLSIINSVPPDSSSNNTNSSSSITPILSSNSGTLSFPFRLQRHFDQQLAIFTQNLYSTANSDSTTAIVDPFFQAVVFGKFPVPSSWLATRDPQTADAVLSALQAVYRRYMAQAISAKMRVPVTSGLGQELQGTLTRPAGVLRVKQNRPSKLALQGLLGMIFVLMAVAIRVTRMRGVLQHNPCTIAGVAALWAGSRVCSRGVDSAGKNGGEGAWDRQKLALPTGAEFMSDRELKEAGVWEGVRFRLGWWDEDLGKGLVRRRYGIDAVRGEED